MNRPDPTPSLRRDGRGHWPAGKRRGVDSRERTKAVRSLARLTGATMSIKEAARQLGVSDRTVRRWLASEDYPMPENLEALQRLVGR